jgi:hypothetical protein
MNYVTTPMASHNTEGTTITSGLSDENLWRIDSGTVLVLPLHHGFCYQP